MGGWKTWTAAAIIAVGAVLEFYGLGELSKLLYGVGSTFGLVGLGHKIEKSAGGRV